MIHKPCLTLKITKDEVKLFSYVLEKGLDMDRMIEICFTEHDKIKDALQAGNSLRRVLFSNQKNVYFQTILVLSSSMSLKMAIDCANRIEEQLQNIFKNFFQNLTYPFCIFIFSYLMILFFSYSIVPQMIMFHEERSFVFLDILKIIYTIVFCWTYFVSTDLCFVFAEHIVKKEVVSLSDETVFISSISNSKIFLYFSCTFKLSFINEIVF